MLTVQDLRLQHGIWCAALCQFPWCDHISELRGNFKRYISSDVYMTSETSAFKNFFSKLTKDYSVTRNRSISFSYETFISHESFREKIKTKKFGLWPLSIKCDNTELLFYVTKLRMNKLRWDEFVPFDIIWKTSSGMDSHCSTVSFHCPPNRLTVIHQGAWE